MGEVIKAAFGRKVGSLDGRGGEAIELSPEELAFAEILRADALWLHEDSEALKLLRNACEQGDAATDHIFGLGNFRKKNESLDLRQDSLKNCALEELSRLLAESHEMKWNMQPHYFGALILEIGERLVYMREVFPHLQIPSFREE